MSNCLAGLLTNKIPLASEVAQQKCYLTYTAPLPAPSCKQLTLLEARSILASSGTTGFRTWESALCLGTYLSSPDGVDFIRGKTILELGAGTGFLSILCAKHLGARFVLATDGSAEVISDLESNIFLNSLDSTNLIVPGILKWGHTLSDELLNGLEDNRTYDLVLGADVVSQAMGEPLTFCSKLSSFTSCNVYSIDTPLPFQNNMCHCSNSGFQVLIKSQTYDTTSIPALIATLRDLFHRNPKTKALISATVRNEDTLTSFTDACG